MFDIQGRTASKKNAAGEMPAGGRSAVAIMLTMVMMLSITVPTTGVVMAEDYLKTQSLQVAADTCRIAEDAGEEMKGSVESFLESIRIKKAPNVRGEKEKVAEKKLSEDFEVKVKHEKMTYEKLAEQSDTLFFGEVKEQSQNMDKITLNVAQADMEDPLTAEMMALGGRLAWPVPSSTNITSHFGHRSSPGGIGSTNHKGLDISAPRGTPIIAAKEGVVESASSFGGYGNCVVIRHDNGYETLYGHMSKITCRQGDTVAPGDVIGKVGSTGFSTGPHLHFSIIKNGTYVDPEPYLTGRNFIEAGEEVSDEHDDVKDKDKDKKDQKDAEDKKSKETVKPSSEAAPSKTQEKASTKEKETQKSEPAVKQEPTRPAETKPSAPADTPQQKADKPEKQEPETTATPTTTKPPQAEPTQTGGEAAQ